MSYLSLVWQYCKFLRRFVDRGIRTLYVAKSHFAVPRCKGHSVVRESTGRSAESV